MLGPERDRLIQVAADLDVELGYGHPHVAVPGERTRGRAETSPLSESDEHLVAAIRAGLARLANGVAHSRGRPLDQSRAIVAALDGAEAVMRGEILCGQVQRLPDLMSDFVFLVTLPVVGREEALQLAGRTRQLLGAEEST